jgi:hypothetical protein
MILSFIATMTRVGRSRQDRHSITVRRLGQHPTAAAPLPLALPKSAQQPEQTQIRSDEHVSLQNLQPVHGIPPYFCVELDTVRFDIIRKDSRENI